MVYTIFMNVRTNFAEMQFALARKVPAGAACQATRGAASRKEAIIPSGIETCIR